MNASDLQRRGWIALFAVATTVVWVPAMSQDAVEVTGVRMQGSVARDDQQAVVIRRGSLVQQSLFTDALQNVTQVHADQAAGRGGFGSVYIRGADPNHAVVLIDGVKVNDPTNSRGGGFDLSAIDSRTLGRAEILPGASSATYGADAMAGVLNLSSPLPSGTGLRATAAIGGLGHVNGSADWDGDRLRIVAGAFQEGSGDLGVNRVRTFSARSDTISVRAISQTSHGFPEDSGGPSYAVRRAHERRESDSLIAGGNFSREYGTAVLRLRIGGLFQQQRSDSPGVSPGLRDPAGLPPTISDTEFQRLVSGVSAETENFRAGVDYERESGSLQSTLRFGPIVRAAAFTMTRETASLTGEFRHRVDDLLVNLGARLDATTGFTPRKSVQAAARQFFSWGSAAASIGTGFKPPSFFALGHPLIGNPALKSETSTSMEFSLSSKKDAPIIQRAAVFTSRYKNLIDFDAGPPPMLVNRDKLRITGAEYSVSGQVAPGVRATGSITSLSFGLPENTPPLRNRPGTKAAASLNSRISSETSLTLNAFHVGRAADSSVPTGNVILRPYTVVNLALAYKKSGMDLLFSIDNVFDKSYEQFVGFQAPGRRVRLQASIGF